jgi:NAD(P)-dependent dehydrogenase (short-subunit alcohol dehydrogenase family)
MSVAIVVGAGPGLGAALCRRFAAGGLTVAAARRRA